MTAIVCRARPGAFVARAGLAGTRAVIFRDDPRLYGVNEAQVDRHH